MPLLKQGETIAKLLAWCFALLLAISAWTAHTATVQYVHDELGRLSAEIDPAGETTVCSYEVADNLLQVISGGAAQAPKRVSHLALTSERSAHKVTNLCKPRRT